MSDLVITIGRQNGSGGREVGQILAGMLGIACYDQELITEAAKRSGLSEEDVRRGEENAKGARMFFYGIPAANPVFAAQSEAILSLAEKGPCVFVGRCADHVLMNRDNVVRVFVHAPMGARIRRSAERNGISEREAYRRITEKDGERASYYQRYTGHIWGDLTNYDIAVDTGRIGVENAAKLILDYIRMSGFDGPKPSCDTVGQD